MGAEPPGTTRNHRGTTLNRPRNHRGTTPEPPRNPSGAPLGQTRSEHVEPQNLFELALVAARNLLTADLMVPAGMRGRRMSFAISL